MNQFHVGQKVVCIDSVVGFEQYLEVKEGDRVDWSIRALYSRLLHRRTA